MSSQDHLEVRLEEWGEHSWWKALLNTVTGTDGSAQMRFVTVPGAGEHDASAHHIEGATFPVVRAQDLDDTSGPSAWSDTMADRLREMDDELNRQGWRRQTGQERHWWSSRYTKTATG